MEEGPSQRGKAWHGHEGELLTFLLECGVHPAEAETLPDGFTAALSERIAEGRIGQGWLEQCERRAEKRHRELLNVLGRGFFAKQWKPIDDVGLDYIRPMALSPDEAAKMDADIKEAEAERRRRQRDRERREAMLKKEVGGGA